MKKSSRALNLMFRFYKEHNFDPFHFLMVGDLLASYDFDDNLVASGYLLPLIRNKIFDACELSGLVGGDVSSILLLSTIPKDMSDIKLKKFISDLPDRVKCLICADLIVSLKNEHELDLDYYYLLFDALKNDFDNFIINYLYFALLDYQNGTVSSSKEVKFASLNETLSSLKPYVLLIGEGIDSFDSFFSELFVNDFLIRVGTEPYRRGISLEERNRLISYALDDSLFYQMFGDRRIVLLHEDVYDRLVWLKILVNRKEYTLLDINKYFKNSAALLKMNMNFCYFDFMQSIDVNIDVKSADFEVDVASLFLPIMSVKSLLLLKAKIKNK